MTRSYGEMEEFPVWFFNLPAANGDLPRAEDIPPAAVTRMTINGTLTAARPGVLRIETTPAVTATVRVDDQSLLGFQNTQGPFEVARTDTRTFNGPKMIDRCRNAWANL